MRNKDFRILIAFLLLLVSFLSCFVNINSSNANIDTAFHTENTQFSYFQFIENNGQSYNISELEISLPSSPWNLSYFEANFTDININQEQVYFENNPTNYYILNKNYNSKLALQLNITEPTIIYSIEIYARRDSQFAPAYIQINGFDIATQKPNNTIFYQPVEFNASTTEGWYTQTFTNPSTLNPGNYSLIIDGSALISTPAVSYFWYNNIVNTTNPDLLIWTNDGSSWSTGMKNQTFLHKFIQKATGIINPEDLDMHLELNGDSYAVSDGISPGTGNVTIKNVNFSPIESILTIPISTNKTVELIFNCSYYMKLRGKFDIFGSVLINYRTQNFWEASFIVDKIYLNNSIKFYYPSNWQNLSIFQNDIDLSSQVSFNYVENSILIADVSLIEGAEIKIEANTPKFDFDLDVRSTEFSLGQELKFSIDTPSPGNYTVNIYDSLGYSIHDSIQTISIPSDVNLYTYLIPENAKEGEYHAYVYFFDGFNAGIEVASFNIQIPLIITFLIILISSIVGISAVASSYVLIKKRKKKVEAKKKAVHDKFKDIINLSHIMVSEKKSSLNVYEQTFSAKTIDATLISGFLSAIRSFGIELTNTDDATQTIKLEYKNSKILMAEFKNFRIVLIMNDSPSPVFLESIKKVSQEIEIKYGKLLESFKGNVQPFTGIEDLLKTHLNTSFLYPLKVIKTGKAKINQLEKNMIGRALDIMKKRKSQYFYITYLMEEKSWNTNEIEVLFNLLEKKVFQPVI